jgi:type IV pilus assembly protein PilF
MTAPRRWHTTVIAAVVSLTAGCITVSPTGNLEQRSEPNLAEAARINTELGAEYARQGNYDIATEKLKKAIGQDSRYAPAHTTLAYVYTQRGDNERAEVEYRRALDLDGSDPEVRNNFGVFLCSQGKTEEADKYFMSAVRDHAYSTPEAGWTNAGLCAIKAKDNARAENDFREALRINPDFPEALAQMATLTFQKQDYLRTRAFLQRYDRTAKPRPDTLLLAARTERSLGDIQSARRYEATLLQSFPESEEAAQLQKRSIVQ